MFLAAIAFFSFGYAAANAVWPSFYAEMFSTKVRFSGLAIGTQLGFLMAGFAPAIVAAMGGIQPGGWVQISHLHRRHLPHRRGLGADGQGNLQDPHQAARPASSARTCPDFGRTSEARRVHTTTPALSLSGAGRRRWSATRVRAPGSGRPAPSTAARSNLTGSSSWS